MKAAVYLKKAKAGLIKQGHPWIFPKAIAHTRGKLISGDLIEIFTESGEPLGFGVYNEHSLYRTRVLLWAWEKSVPSLEDIIKDRLTQALSLRRALNLPNEQTNAYRLFNSEADGLSGIIIDRFNDVVVISSSAYWVERHKDLISEKVTEYLKPIFSSPIKLIWLQTKALSQDGWPCPTHQVSEGHTEVLEGGILYAVDFSQMQKTGLFLDQRENHQRLAALAKGKRVLDLYCYTGGFSLHAAKAAAQYVCAVDSSASAISQAKENAKLNGLMNIEFIKADASHFLNKAEDYDLIILDPPKLIPSQQYLQRAKNYYRFLHRELFKHMREGSLLMTCNCSSALSTQEFTLLVSQQAQLTGKQLRILGVFGPASCHPILPAFPEGNYLTAVLASVV